MRNQRGSRNARTVRQSDFPLCQTNPFQTLWVGRLGYQAGRRAKSDQCVEAHLVHWTF